VPFGSYPGNMPYEYFSDEEHLKLWMETEKDVEKFRRFLERYIYKTNDFSEYLELCGGIQRISELRSQELFIELTRRG
jgi:glutaconate CoA-transferase subunit A